MLLRLPETNATVGDDATFTFTNSYNVLSIPIAWLNILQPDCSSIKQIYY